MKTKEKTKVQLLEEIERLKARNTELESRAGRSKQGEWEQIIGDHLLESSIDRVFLDDLDGTILYANETAVRSTGYGKEELLNLNIRQLIASGHRKYMKRHMKDMLEKGYATFESVRCRKDGSLLPVEVYDRIIENEGKKFVLHIDRDNTKKQLAEELLRKEKGKAEQALMESEERCHLMIENAEQAIVLRQDDKIIFANSKLEKISGYSMEEMNSMPLENLIYPDDRSYVLDYAIRRMQGKKSPDDYSFRIFDRKNNVRWIERHIATIMWDGKPAALIFDSDVTERKQIEEELKLKAQILDNIFDNVAVRDSEGNYIYINEMTSKSLGYREEEFLTMNLRDVLSREYGARFEEKLKEILAGKNSEFEMTLERKDGTALPVEVRTKTLELDGKQYTITVSHDITERKKTEEELQFRAQLLDSASDSIYVHDLDLNLVYANEAAYKSVGLTWEELVKAHTMKLAEADYRAAIMKRMKEVLSKGYCLYETENERKDGSIMPVEIHSQVIEVEQKKFMVSVVRDITERKKAEEELQFRAQMLDSANDSIFVHDLEGNLVYANEAACKSRGYTREELMNAHIKRLKTLAYKTILKRRREEVLSEGYRLYETEHEKKDGSKILVEIYARLIEIEGRKFIVNAARDITERKKTEEELQFRAQLLDSANDSIFVYDVDDRLIYVNEATYKSRGYTREEFMDAYTRKLAEPEFKEMMKPIKEEVLSKGYSLYETENFTKDGSKMPVEVYARLIELGGQKLLVNAVRDITERKQMEEALADEAVRRRILIDQSSDGIVILDDNGKVYESNRRFAEMLGYTREEMTQLHVWDWDTQLTPDQIMELVQVVDETGVHLESVHRRKDGTTYNAEISSNGALLGGKKLIFSVTRDITERKQAEKEKENLLNDIKKVNSRLEESNKELQDFAYIASHDLREPLRKIVSFGSLLQESLGAKLSDDEKENFEFMIDGSNRMQAMIDDLLSYSRITTKAKPFEQVDLNKVIDDLKRLELADRLETTGGIIKVPEPLPYVYGDSSQLHQLLQNLLGNGLKFNRDDVTPEVTVHAHQVDNNMVMVELQDNGIGIDERYQDQIFVMFKRLHSRSKYEGTGIGLASSKKIVARHGGTIGVKSKPGEGSLFWFTLPGGGYVKD